MEEIIVIRVVNPDENVFQAIMDALRGKLFQVIEATSSVLSFGDVEIYQYTGKYDLSFAERAGTSPRYPQFIKTVIGTGYKLVIPEKGLSISR